MPSSISAPKNLTSVIIGICCSGGCAYPAREQVCRFSREVRVSHRVVLKRLQKLQHQRLRLIARFMQRILICFQALLEIVEAAGLTDILEQHARIFFARSKIEEITIRRLVTEIGDVVSYRPTNTSSSKSYDW